jgi:hypothetical protein
MDKLEEIKRYLDVLDNTNISEKDFPQLSQEDSVNLVTLIDNAKAEAKRLHIIELMKKIC